METTTQPKALYFYGDYTSWDRDRIERMLFKAAIGISMTKIKAMPHIPLYEDRDDIKGECLLWLGQYNNHLVEVVQTGNAGKAIEYMKTSLGNLIFKKYKTIVIKDEMEILVADVQTHLTVNSMQKGKIERFTPEHLREISTMFPETFWVVAEKVGTDKQKNSYYGINVSENKRTFKEQAEFENCTKGAIAHRIESLIQKVMLRLIFDKDENENFVKSIFKEAKKAKS